MARKVRDRIIIRNLTSFKQTLHSFDGDTLLVPERAVVAINPKFLWQKLDPALFKILSKDQATAVRRQFNPKEMRDYHARIQATARQKQKELNTKRALFAMNRNMAVSSAALIYGSLNNNKIIVKPQQLPPKPTVAPIKVIIPKNNSPTTPNASTKPINVDVKSENSEITVTVKE